MKIFILIPIAALLLSSCMSTSNLFQDGKTFGKDSVDGAISLTLYQTPDAYIMLDSPKNVDVIEDKHSVAPWVQVQLQYGVTKRLDIGASLGTGVIIGGGLQVFAKYALLPKDSRAGIALMALGGFAHTKMSNEDEDEDRTVTVNTNHEGEKGAISYLTSLYAIPISFDLSNKVTFVFQPMYATERITLRVEETDTGARRRTTKSFESYKVGTGIIIKGKKGGKVHYNITTAYYPATESVVPTFGIAFIPPR